MYKSLPYTHNVQTGAINYLLENVTEWEHVDPINVSKRDRINPQAIHHPKTLKEKQLINNNNKKEKKVKMYRKQEKALRTIYN